MRNILIDLSNDNMHSFPKFRCGIQGEHNESNILVTLPPRMISEDISYYYFKFETANGDVVTSPQIVKSNLIDNNKISVKLWEQITNTSMLTCNVIAETIDNGNIEIKGKTPTFCLLLEDSADGADMPYDPNGNEEALQEVINESLREAMDNAGVVTTEGFTDYGGYLVVTAGPNQLQSQPIGIWDVVTHSSFENNNRNEIVKVTKVDNGDGTYDYRLEASDISADDIVTKEQMELLNETTLTEDAVVIFNTDSSGNELALKKFELLVSLPAVTSATTIWLGINGHCVAYTQASSASATNPVYKIWGEYIPGKNDWDFQNAMNNTNGGGLGTIWAFPEGNRYSGTLPSSAHGVIIATNAALTTALPTGTKVTLWGVRE